MPMMFISDALKTALDFEEKGRIFYLKSAETVEDEFSKMLFGKLAEDESKHAERIKNIFEALETEGPLPSADKLHQKHMEASVQSFFYANKDTLRKETTNIEGYEFAMEMERTGILMYRKFYEQSQNDAEQLFYQAMIKEEQEHLEALKNVHYYMTTPGDWFEEEESLQWTWMSS